MMLVKWVFKCVVGWVSFMGLYLVGMLSVKLPYDLEAPAFPPLSGLLGYLGLSEVTNSI